MSAAPLFTVVIPVYNRANSVLPTLRSVCQQTLPDFECIIVDDESADSEALKQVVASLNDNRFKYIWRPNGGGGAARNTGIQAATGRYIAFLDSDDLFVPEKLATVAAFMQTTKADAIYSKAFVDRGVSNLFWTRPDRAIGREEDMGEYLFVHNQFIQTSTIVMRTPIAQSVMFNPDLRKGQDLDFCIRAAHLGYRFEMLPHALVIWTDISEMGRTSRHAGADGPMKWLALNRSLLSRRAYLGYRATVLSYYQPKAKFLTVLTDLGRALVFAGVPLKVVLRQFLRFALPRTAYRTLVSLFLRTRGKARVMEA